MTSIVEIVEILRPSAQGITTPYLCRGEDDKLYYVKGRHSHCRSLWSEWICGHLAHSVGLNVPEFTLVHVDQALLDETQSAWRELGEGLWFASLQHPVASWLEAAGAASTPPQIKQQLFMFDWWIRNMDRGRGNTNLLWDAVGEHIVVIDHNQAFDPDFSPAEFLEHHVFADVFDAVAADQVLRQDFAARLFAAVAVAKLACENAPESWNWSNAEGDLPCPFNVGAAFALLEQSATEQLWSKI